MAWAKSGPTGMAPASPAPLMPSGLSGEGVSTWSVSMRGTVVGGGQQVVHKGGVEQLAVFVEDELLVEGIADALGDAALDLALEDHGVDDAAAVVDDDVALDLDLHGLGVDLDDHGVDARGGGAALGAKVVGGLEAGFGAGLDGAAQRVGLERQVAELDGGVRRALDLDGAVGDLQVLLVHLQLAAMALRRIFWRTATAAAWMALPATTAPRQAKVPAPQ